MLSLISLILFGLCGFCFFQKRVRRYMRYFQQEDYNSDRFRNWLVKARAFDKKGSAIVLSAVILDLITSAHTVVVIAAAVGIYIASLTEKNPALQGKLILKMTDRAKRILRMSYGLYGILFFIMLLSLYENFALFLLAQMVVIQAIPRLLIFSGSLLKGSEERRQQAYLAEAKSILKKVNPFIIGITGSYGKTSTKDALGQILQVAVGPTFWPGKGINTPMGNTREIRSGLKEGTKYAIFEMGAYGRGSIKRLCDLTPPQAAIITSIGSAHLERFGSLDNIRMTKAELAEALPSDGILVCNGDDPGARRIAAENPKKQTLLYGFDDSFGSLDCKVTTWKITPKGTEFIVLWKGKEYQGLTPLLGKPALANLMGAFTLACSLGGDPEYVLGVIQGLDPVDNRLQMQKEGTVTYLRDAYNSNPIGFAAALDVMKVMPASRRIVMTPGIIELGPKQYEENEKVGFLSAQVCDLAIIVGPTNRSALVAGLNKGGLKSDQLLLFDQRDTALKKLASLKQEGDLILIENDLPDLYETKEFF